MTKKNGTKRSLLMSALALVLCLSMLVGSTFAWFTDSVTSSGNKIQAGTLDVDLYMWDGDSYENISSSTNPIFGAGSIAQNNNAETLWEPGKTQVAYLKLVNNGTLNLKYKVSVNVVDTDAEQNLYEVMQYAIIPDAANGSGATWDDATAKNVVVGINSTDAVDVEMAPDAEHFFALAIHMDESAGNKYQGGQVTFDIRVDATQATGEADSFGTDYDILAALPVYAYAEATDVSGNLIEIEVMNKNTATPEKVAVVKVPADAVHSNAEKIEVRIAETDYDANITIAAGSEAVAFDITVSGLKDDNDTPVDVMVFIGEGLDPATVKLYHYENEIACNYNPNTGYVTFASTSFSPFTVVFDAESEYVAPEVPEDEEGKAKYPKATVTYAPDYVGAGKVQWGSYGAWSPTPGLSSDLEAAFTFTCPNYDEATAEMKAIIDAYRHWYCDFYVSLDRELGANQIFLGGYYASFSAYVGFHNGDLTLAANEEIPLLGSVTTNPWTYQDVERNVGEFLCGVGDVDNALEGATFTVKLRLTNPENEAEFYDVNVVTYTFGGNYTIS